MSKKPSDRQRRIDRGKRVPVGLAVITQQEFYMTCSCGAVFKQKRLKVREERAAKHIDEKHEGRGIWL